MAQGTLSIHSENILPIIKKWLYSDKDIFLRELVSNACDAMHKLQILRDQNSVDIPDSEFRIDITLNKESLVIADTGIGMTADEVKKYIAQIAFSGAEEFVEKYKSKQEIIGHFGLGFYSSYMVASHVEIDTLSFQENAVAAHWSCDGSSEYKLEKGKRDTRGTAITLHIDKENAEFLEEARIKQLLTRYCYFLPFPIYLNGAHINNKNPLWLKNPSDCTDKEYLEFYRELYPMDRDPIFWIHLNVDYPFNLKGILYFPKVDRKFDTQQNSIKLFCNRVFVSDNCKDLFPDYLMILKGAIDSPDIPLNVSRSYLQMDRNVRQLGTHIAKKVADRLSSLYKTNLETFIKNWQDVEAIIKLGILQDEKFYERCKEFLIFKTTEGQWTTVEDYLERNREKTSDKIFYTAEEKQHAHFLNLYKEKGIEILLTNNFLDTPIISHLEGKLAPVKFQRIDGAIDETILDKSREKNILDADGKTGAGKLADFIRSSLGVKELEVEAKSLANDNVAAFIMLDEQTRRMRDYMTLTQGKAMDQLFDKKTFVVNTNNSLVQKTQGLQQKNPDLAKKIVRQIYDLSLLSQKEFDADNLTDYVQRSQEMLEELLTVQMDA